MPRQPNLTGNQRTRIADRARALYEEGASVRSVARHIGYSYGTAHTLLLEAGTTLRDRGGHNRKPAD